MTPPVPNKAPPGAKLKYRFDLVRRNDPLVIRLTGAPSNGYRRNLSADTVDAKVQNIRALASRYASRHGLTFQVSITKRSSDNRSVTLEIHYIGRRA